MCRSKWASRRPPLDGLYVPPIVQWLPSASNMAPRLLNGRPLGAQAAARSCALVAAWPPSKQYTVSRLLFFGISRGIAGSAGGAVVLAIDMVVVSWIMGLDV